METDETKGASKREIRLGDNIKLMRKSRGLTQEALADALNVTVGAVYKWEAGLSYPELTMIVRLADMFDVSVDVLLGYEKVDNRRASIVHRIYELIGRKDRAALEEADKALLKYPNDYSVIKASALIYTNFGLEDQDKAYIQKGITLYEKALCMIPADEDPRYGELYIRGSIATLYNYMGESEKAINMLKENNQSGIFDPQIGSLMALGGNGSQECFDYLTGAFWRMFSDTINTMFGFASYYKTKGDTERIKAVAEWGIAYLDSLRDTDKPCFLDKMACGYMTVLCYAHFKNGDTAKAEEVLASARSLAEAFDSAPYFSINVIKLFEAKGEGSSYDTLGKTAADTIATVTSLINDKKFTSFLKNR